MDFLHRTHCVIISVWEGEGMWGAAWDLVIIMTPILSRYMTYGFLWRKSCLVSPLQRRYLLSIHPHFNVQCAPGIQLGKWFSIDGLKMSDGVFTQFQISVKTPKSLWKIIGRKINFWLERIFAVLVEFVWMQRWLMSSCQKSNPYYEAFYQETFALMFKIQTNLMALYSACRLGPF